jgi:hypothetical protein
MGSILELVIKIVDNNLEFLSKIIIGVWDYTFCEIPKSEQ